MQEGPKQSNYQPAAMQRLECELCASDVFGLLHEECS